MTMNNDSEVVERQSVSLHFVEDEITLIIREHAENKQWIEFATIDDLTARENPLFYVPVKHLDRVIAALKKFNVQ